MLRSKTNRVLSALANRGAERETAGEHVRNAIQLLMNLLAFGSLDREDRKDVSAAIRRLRLALREVERGNP